jgi:peptide/nickel transport system substrate-binding protein
MLRGFRWQLLVFVMALGLFGASLLSRPAPEPVASQPTASPPPATATPEPVSPSTVAVAEPAVLAVSSTGSVPTFREALIGEVQRLNPLFAALNPVDRDISALIYEGLTRINEFGEAVPGLATEWVISTDGLEYVFQLRGDVLWQDGTPFTAVDVVYTFGLLQSEDFPGDPALVEFWRTIEVQQLANDMVRFRLTQPLGRFLDAASLGILPEHALRGTTAAQIANHPINLAPIGTGPYQLEGIRSLDGSRAYIVDLRAAPVYRQRPEGQTGYSVDRMRFQLYETFDQALAAFRSGQVDGLASRTRAESSVLMNLPTVNVHTAIDPTLGAVIFNWARESTPFFREARVRQALIAALDRAPIIARNMGNSAILANSPLIPGSWAYYADTNWPPVNVEAARQLIETARNRQGSSNPEATEEPGTSRPSFDFGILTLDAPDLVGTAQEIASQWSQIGITVRVEAVDINTYQTRLDSGEFDAALIELSMAGSADPDVFQFWDADQYPDGLNYGGIDDRRIAENLERARSDYSGINRIIRYRNFQQDFISRGIAIPLYYPLFTYATGSTVSGVQLAYLASPASRFFTIQDWALLVG